MFLLWLRRGITTMRERMHAFLLHEDVTRIFAEMRGLPRVMAAAMCALPCALPCARLIYRRVLIRGVRSTVELCALPNSAVGRGWAVDGWRWIRV